MTGRRFCTDCPEFSRTPSQETLKSRFPGFWISWKVTSTQNGHWSPRLHPNWSAVVTEWSIGAPGSFQNNIKNNRNPNTKSGDPKISKFAKTRTETSSRLVWLKSSQLPWRSIWWQIGCIMSTHDASWVFTWCSNDTTWVLMINKWCIMSTHAASWVLMIHHEYSWCIMDTHAASWVLMVHHEYSWSIMSTHDASLILMLHHEYSLCITSTHEASGVLMMHHEYSWCIMSTFWRGPWCSSTMLAIQKQLFRIHHAPHK